MTLNEIKNSKEAFLTCSQIAEVLGVNPQSLRVAIKNNQKAVGFNTVVIGSRILIPRQAFLDYISGRS